MRTSHLVFSLVTACAATASFGQTVHQLELYYFVTDLSEDGSVAVGNRFGSFETFRWTEATGEVLLGRATAPVLGVGAGTPDISYDGTRISATITNANETFATFGLWTLGQGWVSAETPLGPANSTVVDLSLASTWGISGDGENVTGFYWNQIADAQPCLWNPTDGVTPLPVNPLVSARVNASNFDGSVTCGWEERPDGAWQSTVWREGVKIRLAETDAFVAAESVNADGSVVVGQGYRVSTAARTAAIWRWDGEGYVEQLLGVLPGTPAIFGSSIANAVSDDGSIVVGSNFYGLDPSGLSDGFVWTEATGLVNAEDYFASLGFVLPEDFELGYCDAMSPDGRTFAVSGTYDSGDIGGLILSIDDACAGDCDGSGSVDFNDLVGMLFAFGPAGGGDACDADESGVIDFNDLVAALFLFGPCS